MKSISIKEKNYNILESWDEIKLGKFIDLIRLWKDKDELPETLFFIKFIPLICDITEEELYSFEENDLIPLSDFLTHNFDMNKFKKKKCGDLLLNNKTYSAVKLNSLTVGERISLDLLDKSSQDDFDRWLNRLSILVRPSISETNEFDEVEFIPEKFKADVALLTKRKKLMLDIPAVNSIWILESFPNGRK